MLPPSFPPRIRRRLANPPGPAIFGGRGLRRLLINLARPEGFEPPTYGSLSCYAPGGTSGKCRCLEAASPARVGPSFVRESLVFLANTTGSAGSVARLKIARAHKMAVNMCHARYVMNGA